MQCSYLFFILYRPRFGFNICLPALKATEFAKPALKKTGTTTEYETVGRVKALMLPDNVQSRLKRRHIYAEPARIRHPHAGRCRTRAD